MQNYNEYQEIVKILEKIKSYINDETDTIWAGFNNTEDLLIELNKDIELLKLCDYETLVKVNIDFLPTCTYQELSLSNGWSDEYLIMSEKFDKCYQIIKDKKQLSNIIFMLNPLLYI